jgi:hypothetical protein
MRLITSDQVMPRAASRLQCSVASNWARTGVADEEVSGSRSPAGASRLSVMVFIRWAHATTGDVVGSSPCSLIVARNARGSHNAGRGGLGACEVQDVTVPAPAKVWLIA